MRLRNASYILCLLCATSILHTSCVEDDLKRAEPLPQGEGYVSMNIDMGNLPTTTRSGDEAGTAAEMAVHDVRIVLYDGTDANPGSCKVEYVFDLDAVDYTQALNGNTLELSTAAQRVAAKPYKMLVLINGKDIVLANAAKSIYNVTNKGCFLFQLYEAAGAEVNPLTGSVSGGTGFFMSNHQDLVDVPETALKNTVTDAQDAPVRVAVSRLVAKTTVRHKAGFTFPAGVDPQSATWGTANTNKQTYWMRKMVGSEGSQISMANLYAEDPNYDLKATPGSHFNKILFADDGSVSLHPSAITNSFGEYEYLLENTTSAVTAADNAAFLNQTTHLIVGYKYTPSGFGANESYYIFDNKVYSVATMREYKDNVTSLPSIGLSNLEAAINATNQNLYPLDGSGSMYFETNGIRFCPQGQIYYFFPIRHFNQPEGSLGYYGVVRNNIYDITINSLTSPELANNYLSTQIEILPWSMRGQSNKIGVTIYDRKWVPVKLYHWFYKDGTNLYWKWTNYQYQYETIMAYVGQTLSVTRLNKDEVFRRDMPAEYSNLYYIYTHPAFDQKVSEDPALNVYNMYYTQGYMYAGFAVTPEVCFVKEDGTILTIAGWYIEYNGVVTTVTENPKRCLLNVLVKIGGDPEKGYVFVKNLVDLYNLVITDSGGNEYEVDGPSLARYYNISGTLGQTQVDWGTFPTTRMEEPIDIASRQSGGSFTVPGNTGIAVICKRKNP